MSYENYKGKVVAAPEILGAELSADNIDVAALKADANAYIKVRYNADVPSTIKIVENDAETIHLSLPYYDGLEQAAESVKDEDLENVDGAEIIALIIAAIVGAIAAASAVAATTVGVAITETNEAKQGRK